MHELGMTEGFDVGMEMSGNAQAFQDLVGVMNNGGRVAVLGIFPQPVAIDWGLVCFHGLFLKGIYGREMFETWYKMTTMLQSGLDISAVITHRFPVDEYLNGFEVMKKGESGKVILDWQ
jgi:threonine 3-dehydrogenase